MERKKDEELEEIGIGENTALFIGKQEFLFEMWFGKQPQLELIIAWDGKKAAVGVRQPKVAYNIFIKRRLEEYSLKGWVGKLRERYSPEGVRFTCEEVENLARDLNNVFIYTK